MTRADRFNATGFSQWVNGPSGRVFRIVVGAAWLGLAIALRGHWTGVVAAVWSVFPLSAGLLDICWVSAALGGPLQGRAIRAGQVARTS